MGNRTNFLVTKKYIDNVNGVDNKFLNFIQTKYYYYLAKCFTSPKGRFMDIELFYGVDQKLKK